MKADITKALASVSPAVREAVEKSHEVLVAFDVPHALIGGIAVNAFGHQYSTHDVDYLVDPAHAFRGTLVVSLREGLPFKVGEVVIDYLDPRPTLPKPVLKEMRACLKKRGPGIPVISVRLLVYMKLHAGRMKDMAAVEGLLRTGIDADLVEKWLKTCKDAEVLGRWYRCVKASER